MPIPAVRGDITSSDGTVLAMTVQTDQVTADPPEIRQSMKAAESAAGQGGSRARPAAADEAVRRTPLAAPS